MRHAVMLLTGILLGCSDPMDAVSLDFRADPLRSEDLSEWSVVRLESGHHRVIVRRAADASGSCDDLRADLLRTGHELTLRVSDSARGGIEGKAQPCGYTAVINQIPSGRYRLRIVHSGPTSRSGAPVVMDHPLHIR